MTRPVYSAAFGVGVVPGALTAFFVVPAGVVAVIRDIELQEIAGGTPTVVVELRRGGTTYFSLKFVLAANGLSSWHGRIVVPAGDEMRWNVTATTVYGYVGGYELTAT